MPFPSPGYPPNPGIEPWSSTLQVDSLPSEPPGKSFHKPLVPSYSPRAPKVKSGSSSINPSGHSHPAHRHLDLPRSPSPSLSAALRKSSLTFRGRQDNLAEGPAPQLVLSEDTELVLCVGLQARHEEEGRAHGHCQGYPVVVGSVRTLCPGGKGGGISCIWKRRKVGVQRADLSCPLNHPRSQDPHLEPLRFSENRTAESGQGWHREVGESQGGQRGPG